MTSENMQNPNLEPDDKRPGLLARRQEQQKRAADFISVVGRKEGISTLREMKKIPAGGNIRTVRTEQLPYSFFMTAAKSDIDVFTEIMAGHRYELPETMDSLIDSYPIIDVGANIGASAVYFASRYPDSYVVAIEPHQRNYELLAYNAGQYLGQIEPLIHSLSLQEGRTKLTNPGVGNSGQHSQYRFEGLTDATDADSSPTITPDNIVKNFAHGDRIGLLKVSIEGAEAQIFANPASDSLLERSNVVIIEAHDAKTLGSREAVLKAAERNGLRQFDQRGPFKFFINSKQNTKHKITL